MKDTLLVLTLVLLLVRISGLEPDLSWWVVFAPLWIMAAAWCVILAFAMVVILLCMALDAFNQNSKVKNGRPVSRIRR